MKLSLLFLLACVASSTMADTPSSDMAIARAKYEKEITVLTKPARDRYVQELQRLKKRAIAGNDLKLAVAIDEEITSLSKAASPQPAAPQFETAILNTTWTWVHPEEQITFGPGGSASIGKNSSYTWKITSSARRTIEGAMSNGRKFSFSFSPDLKSADAVLDGFQKWKSAIVPSP